MQRPTVPSAENKIASMNIHDDVPVVLVAADAKLIDGVYWHAVIETYLNALVHGAGAAPLILPAAVGAALDLDAILQRIDGVLLPGSRSNVHPARYGEAPSPRAEPHDELRDTVTMPLIQAALRHGVPLFAISIGLEREGQLVDSLILAVGADHNIAHRHLRPRRARR